MIQKGKPKNWCRIIKKHTAIPGSHPPNSGHVFSKALQPAESGRIGVNKVPEVVDVGNSFCGTEGVRKGVILLTFTFGRTTARAISGYTGTEADQYAHN